MINERVKYLKSLINPFNHINTDIRLDNELQWLEQLKEYMLDINKKITETEDSDMQVILYMAMFNGLFGCSELIGDSNE